METVLVSTMADGTRLYIDKYAHAADGIVLVNESDAFLEDNRLTKGSMMLIDEAQARALYEKLGYETTNLYMAKLLDAA